MDGTIKVTLYLPKALWKNFKLHAVGAERNYSDLVREALEEYLQKNDPQELRPRGK